MQQAHTAETSAGQRRPARSETSGASYRTSRAPAGPRDKTQSGQRGASGHQPAERGQWRELPDEPGASGSARRVRAEANQSSGKAPEKQARAGRAKTSGDARYERREGVRGRPKAAGRLTQKLPSPEVAFSGIKGGGASWVLQSRRSEHPHGGNCTERHRARTHCETDDARRA